MSKQIGIGAASPVKLLAVARSRAGRHHHQVLCRRRARESETKECFRKLPSVEWKLGALNEWRLEAELTRRRSKDTLVKRPCNKLQISGHMCQADRDLRHGCDTV